MILRHTRHEILHQIRTRFSNRAFEAKDVPRPVVEALIEAASFAPSCFNEQPWRFVVARDAKREKLLEAMTPLNREWAQRAPVLLLVCAKKTFTLNGKENPWHLSDTGCATGFLIIEAERRGLTAHPMGGFSKEQAREAFAVGDGFDVVEIIALGWPGNEEALSPKNRERNRPQPRMDIEDFVI